jgi:hypothetical protein
MIACAGPMCTLSKQQVFVGPASQVISLSCSHLIGLATRRIHDSLLVFTEITDSSLAPSRATNFEPHLRTGWARGS